MDSMIFPEPKLGPGRKTMIVFGSAEISTESCLFISSSVWLFRCRSVVLMLLCLWLLLLFMLFPAVVPSDRRATSRRFLQAFQDSGVA